jgi:hypothetical protein
VLEKNGPTTANAAAFAEITGVQGITLNTLGFDIRSNTHCGGAPYFNVQGSAGFFFVGNCSPASYTSLGGGWSRVRMTAANIFPPVGSLAAMGTIQSIDIAFDEGTDTPVSPPFIVTPGKTVIDNIAINNKLITKPGPA